MMRYIFAAFAAALTVGSVHAADTDPCGTGMVCASAPQTVVKAMRDAGYKADFSMDDSGDPMIESEASGYDFTVFFYDCEAGAQCGAIQFIAGFEGEDSNTPELANQWNQSKRFIQVSVDDARRLSARYDLATIGGLNQKNFSDVLDWWEVMLGDLGSFFEEHAGGN